MARSDLLFSLVQASASGDDKLLRSTVESIVAEEHAKKHHLLAQKLWTAFTTGQRKTVHRQESKPIQKQKSLLEYNSSSSLTEALEELLYEITPQFGLKDLYLSHYVLETCIELIEEQIQADILRQNAVEPRSRILLSGAPGNGKTSLAHAIAYECGLPLYIIRYEAVVSSFLGETSNKLKRIFDFVKQRPCVIFFDEFDTLGKERGDAHETGEIKRVVSSLLLQIDALPTFNIVIAATNHSELIDRAAWRRFQIRLELNSPRAEQIEKMIIDFEKDIKQSLELSRPQLLLELSGLSYSEIEQFLLDIKRRWILKNPGETLQAITRSRLKSLANRLSNT